MTSDALLILQFLFSGVFALFTSWHIPGTHVTPAEFAFFLLTASVLFRFIRRLAGSGGGDDA